MSTIVAIATGNTNAGVSIVRLSGERSFEIAQKCLKNLAVQSMQDRKMYLAQMKFGDVQDKALAVKFVAPYSFTGEDVFEFQVHGGEKLSESIVNFLITSGAKLAEPGEFSKRAFLNGKLSLEEAESVIDMISAQSTAELNASFSIMIGKLKSEIESIQSILTDCLAEIEVAIDYPEEDIDFKTETDIKTKLEDIRNRLQNLYQNSKVGSVIKSGIQVSIVGKPNVGKSSLLNALLNYEKAIVTDEEGTTRDIVDGTYEYNGVKVNLSDTAGIRVSENKVEQIGIQKSIDSLKACDIILLLFDGSKPLDEKDVQILNLLKAQYIKKPLICIVNKKDLPNYKRPIEIDDLYLDFTNIEVLEVSIKDNQNLDVVKQKIYDFIIKDGLSQNALYITNARQIASLQKALDSISNSIKQIGSIGLDCVCVDIREAWNSLGEITGKNITEEIVDSIFNKFCLGK